MVLRGFIKPAPTFYFLSVILLAGGVGFWYPFIDHGRPDLNSAMTYIFALLAAVVADFFTSSRSDDFLDNWKIIEKDFTVLVVSLVVVITSLTTMAVILKECFLAWFFITIAALLVWLLWWILLEPQKFGIPPDLKQIEKSTIGDLTGKNKSESAGLSLKDLKSRRYKDAGDE